jgi:hypothetical protein
MDVENRNAEIERLYRDEGWTYQRIGDAVGLTRQRVQVILKVRGADDVAASKAVRRDRIDTAIAASNERFDASAGPAIRKLLLAQVPAEEVARRLTALGIDVTEKDVRAYAGRQHLAVPRLQAPLFSDGILRLALLAAAAQTAGLRIAADDAALIDADELEALRDVSTGSAEVAAIAALAVSAKTSDEPLSLTKVDYERWRASWLLSHPKTDAAPWPPTSQTFMKRLGRGYWNDAVRDAGLVHNTRGRIRGALVFRGNDEYEGAVIRFIAEAAESSRSATYEEYERWAADRPVPSGPSVRNRFGSWIAAKNAAADVSGLPAMQRRRFGLLAADRLVDWALERLDADMRRADERVTIDEHAAVVALALKDSADDLLDEMVADFERFRREWLYAAVKEDPTPFLARVADDGAATKDEKARWKQVSGADPRRVVESVVSSLQFDGYLNARSGDLRNGGGWLAAVQQARLDRIDPADTLRWRVVKAARNVLVHKSRESLDLLAENLAQVHFDDELRVRTPPNSPRNVIRWLAAEVDPPPGYERAGMAGRRIGHLHAVLTRTAAAMRSTAADR